MKLYDTNLNDQESAYPDLFHPIVHPSSALSTREQLSVVHASAPSFHETASRLTTLKDLPIPPTSASTQLISLGSRIGRLQQAQQRHEREVRELRARSARAIERWYELDVLGTGECWAEWESRLEQVEKQVRRQERAKQTDEREERAYQD